MLNNTPLDPMTSASDVMIEIIKMRFRQYLRNAILSVRWKEKDQANYHAGVAAGQVCVLYDTKAPAWRYLKAIEAVRRAIAKME